MLRSGDTKARLDFFVKGFTLHTSREGGQVENAYVFTVGVRQWPGNHGGLLVRGAPRGQNALTPGEV